MSTVEMVALMIIVVVVLVWRITWLASSSPSRDNACGTHLVRA